MAAEPMSLLLHSTLVASFAALALLLARRGLRRVFGARAAYAFWALLPVAVAAVLLPAPRAVPLVSPMVLPTMVVSAPAAAADAAIGWEALLALWLAGALAMAAREALRQRRFVAALGALQPREGLLHASVPAGPVVLGLWRPRIVVPVDFETRFDAEERALILEHERVHVARRDLAFNLLAVAIRCLQWFNPLLHLAFVRFRQDQELAADAVVLQRRPEARRRYAEAMLKAQVAPSFSPLGCQWQSAHPLKERILMLKRPIPGFRRLLLGVVSALILTLGSGYVAWAAQPQPMSEVEEQATYASLTPPRYPANAIAAKAEGNVLLVVQLDASGAVQEVEVETSAGHPDLDAAAVAAVRGWRFNPARNGGKAVPSRIGVPIQFSLKETPAAPAAVEQDGTLDRIDVREG